MYWTPNPSKEPYLNYPLYKIIPELEINYPIINFIILPKPSYLLSNKFPWYILPSKSYNLGLFYISCNLISEFFASIFILSVIALLEVIYVDIFEAFEILLFWYYFSIKSEYSNFDKIFESTKDSWWRNVLTNWAYFHLFSKFGSSIYKKISINFPGYYSYSAFTSLIL